MAAIKFHERVSRSLVKAITYRILIITSDTIVVFFLTHRIDITLGVVLFTNVASSLLYFFHERIWNAIHWGKMKR